MSVLGTAECEHVLSGKVVDALTQDPIVQTHIESIAESIKTLTDDQGTFKLEGLCSATPSLKLTKVGYVSKEHTIAAEASEKLVLTLSPVPDENIEKVVVRASRTRAAETRSISSLDEEAIRREGGKNLADTLAELPGVSVLRSGNVAKPIVLSLIHI